MNTQTDSDPPLPSPLIQPANRDRRHIASPPVASQARVPRRAARAAAVLAFAACIALTILVPQHGRGGVLAGIRVYQRTIAPIAARMGATCRFEPTCSRYAEIVIAREGVLAGGWKTLRRLARCGPWTPAGTRDEP